jgi:DNA (cytosine-5)-methyltransferase 1
VLENVPGIATIDGGDQLKLALNYLASLGYSTSEVAPVEAAHYGVPQWRRRIIIWGSRTIGNPGIPPKTHAELLDFFSVPGVKTLNTVAHALVGMKEDLPNHTVRDHKRASQERYRLLRFGERDQLGRADRLDPSRPSKTVIAGGLSGGGRSHLHPFVARTLSVRESARLQTFPDTFVFEGSTARQFTQVGNAVPPLLAEHFARHILREEFGLPPAKKLFHEQPLLHGKSVEHLVKRLLDESKRASPAALYASDVSLASVRRAG